MASSIRGREHPRVMDRIIEKASDRAKHLCDLVVEDIATNGPYDPQFDDGGVHLKDSYYVTEARDRSGDWVIKTHVRYWSFVEFGTRRVSPPYSDMQPHIRPAVNRVQAMVS